MFTLLYNELFSERTEKNFLTNFSIVQPQAIL